MQSFLADARAGAWAGCQECMCGLPGAGGAPAGWDGWGVSEQWRGGVPPVPSAYLPGSAGSRPGSVTTAGVLAMIIGVIGALGGAVLIATASSADLRADSGESPETLRTVGIIAVVVCVAMIVTGRQTLKGRRWARWALSLLFLVGVVGGVAGGVSTESMVGLAICALALIMLWTPGARRWFAARR